jgi:hypothetical protein
MVERTKFVHIKPTETTQILASYSELRPSVVPNPAWRMCNVEFSYQNSSQGLPVTCVFFEWVDMTLIPRPNDIGANAVQQPLQTPTYCTHFNIAWEM